MINIEEFDKLLNKSPLYQDIIKRLDEHLPVVHKQPSSNNGLLSGKRGPQHMNGETMGFSDHRLQEILTQSYDEQSSSPDGIRLIIRERLYEGLGYTPTRLENVLYVICVNFNRYVSSEYMSTLLTGDGGAKYVTTTLKEIIHLEVTSDISLNPNPMPVLAEFLSTVTSILIHFDVVEQLRGHWRF